MNIIRGTNNDIMDESRELGVNSFQTISNFLLSTRIGTILAPFE